MKLNGANECPLVHLRFAVGEIDPCTGVRQRQRRPVDHPQQRRSTQAQFWITWREFFYLNKNLFSTFPFFLISLALSLYFFSLSPSLLSLYFFSLSPLFSLFSLLLSLSLSLSSLSFLPSLTLSLNSSYLLSLSYYIYLTLSLSPFISKLSSSPLSLFFSLSPT